jgi:hypothetical protein
MLFVAGLVLLALGLLSGVFLLLFPLGVVAGLPGMALWVLFPVFTMLGYLMAAAPARDAMVPLLSRITGALLVLMALAAATVLVLQGGGMMAPSEDTTPLWYVLVVGIVLGAAGLASHGRGAGGTKPAA